MMKRILIGMLLALPLAVASFPSQASAAKIVVIPTVHKPKVAPRPVIRQKLIPGHWEKTPHGRRWVPAHYVRIK
ncbi:MAG: YXWGXW repeat-containing protein [Nostoc sp. ZfuVER08]|nr:YXWGXW repeat-containing protein [Nostoc punctiforme]MBD2614637.1 YXWGXW repeat-containing protein [Nostoc punctiforme FACHB-252]MBL1202704.1 hypothetical protein [Nostoc sp. GBBB01]MDZ8015941.1 YXWGXW repeat-containing protein [Nostoc sp. ZfuVER08]